jgi:hypothetical protein
MIDHPLCYFIDTIDMIFCRTRKTYKTMPQAFVKTVLNFYTLLPKAIGVSNTFIP